MPRRRTIARQTKLYSLLEEFRRLLKTHPIIPVPKKSSVKNDPSKVVKAILRELLKFKLAPPAKKPVRLNRR